MEPLLDGNLLLGRPKRWHTVAARVSGWSRVDVSRPTRGGSEKEPQSCLLHCYQLIRIDNNGRIRIDAEYETPNGSKDKVVSVDTDEGFWQYTDDGGYIENLGSHLGKNFGLASNSLLFYPQLLPLGWEFEDASGRLEVAGRLAALISGHRRRRVLYGAPRLSSVAAGHIVVALDKSQMVLLSCQYLSDGVVSDEFKVDEIEFEVNINPSIFEYQSYPIE
jgi:hypothetical protein